MKNTIKLGLLVLVAIIGIQAMPNGNTKKIIDPSKSLIKWEGKKVVYGHNGTVSIKEGSLLISKGKINGGSFVIDMTSLKCTDIEDQAKNANLIGHLKDADFFDVAKYPTSKLVIKKIGELKDGVQTITADLTIKDKTNPITFSTSVKTVGGKVMAGAKFSIDRTKYDIRYGSDSFFDNLGDKAIKNEINFEVSLVSN
ncbi:MAG: YceI family protein [Chitinophagales bacterium]|nr:YceI family protein [Chitinophagales bacterium]